MIQATSIEFLQNLSQYHYDNVYYDLHNDYDCEKIWFSNGLLVMIFVHLIDKTTLQLQFNDVELSFIELNSTEDKNTLVIDNIYRGRAEISGELVETKDSKGYFYIEFYEGQKFEFWSSGVLLVQL